MVIKGRDLCGDAHLAIRWPAAFLLEKQWAEEVAASNCNLTLKKFNYKMNVVYWTLARAIGYFQSLDSVVPPR